MIDIRIDEQIQRLLRPLSDSELDALTANILADGRIRDPLVVWDETGILVDGHHRLAIAEKHDVPYNVFRRSFADLDDVREWVSSNQAGRRNWDKEERNAWMRERRADGWTYQQIADAAGVDKNTAWRVANDVLISQMGIENERGQQRPAAYAPRQMVTAMDEEDEEDEEERGEHITVYDEHGGQETYYIEGDWEIVQKAQDKQPHVLHNSGNNEWYTPSEFIDSVYEVLGEIDLDPASSEIANRTVGALRYYSIEDDGLAQHWRGRVFMNPPYAGDLVGKFTAKLCQHVRAGDITEAIVLVNNATETVWFQEMARMSQAVCFPRRRVRFLSPDGETGAPLQGQAFLYFGPNALVFAGAFDQHGVVF